jgi:hypothetical protein
MSCASPKIGKSGCLSAIAEIGSSTGAASSVVYEEKKDFG